MACEDCIAMVSVGNGSVNALIQRISHAPQALHSGGLHRSATVTGVMVIFVWGEQWSE